MSTSGEDRRPGLRRVLAFGALWAAVSGAVLLVPGCYGRNCEGAVETFDPQASQGRMIDENSWESNPVDGAWLWFPRQRYYSFEIPALGGRTPKLVLPYITPGVEGPRNGGNATIGSGNVAELFWWGPNHVDVKNDTCSDYYLRLYLEVPPLPPESPTAAAGP